MPTIRLTQVAVDKLKPPRTGRKIFWDNLLPGFGLRITSIGCQELGGNVPRAPQSGNGDPRHGRFGPEGR
jgi:hypothetical protein